MKIEDLTVTTSFYNKPEWCFKRYVEGIEKNGVQSVIYDDGSDEEHKEMLYRLTNGKSLFTVIDGGENRGAIKAFVGALENVKTEYSLKLDADDILLSIQDEFFEEDNWFTSILNGKNSTSEISHFFNRKKFNPSYAPSIVKTETSLDIYKEISDWVDYKNYFSDDVVAYIQLISLGNFILPEKPSRELYARQFSDESISMKELKRVKNKHLINHLFCSMIFKDDEWYWDNLPERLKDPIIYKDKYTKGRNVKESIY